MRRTILLLVVALLALVLVAPAASAIPEPAGCPPEASGWYFTDYITAGNWTDPGYVDLVDETGMWKVLFELTVVGQAFMDAGLAGSQAETYWDWTHRALDATVDRNADDVVCVHLSTSGDAVPGLPVDYGMRAIDNNARA